MVCSIKKIGFISSAIFCFISALNGLPRVNLGQTNILDGGPIRPNPGLYWQEINQVYHAKNFLDAFGKPQGGVNSPHYNYWSINTQLIYQFAPKNVLKGMPGIIVGVPITLYSRVERNALGISDSGSGFGNLTVGAYTQWDTIFYHNRPFFIHRLELDTIIPCGKNKQPCKTINPAYPFFYFTIHWSATLYLTSRWTASWRVHYLWNDTNIKTHQQDGDAIHLNYSTAYEMIPHFHVGVVGYFLQQLRNNRIYGVAIPNTKERVFAIGPGSAYFFSQDLIFLNYLYFEADVRNRPRGTRFILRLVVHF